MSSIDNAFIKVYQRDVDRGRRRRAASNVAVDDRGITVSSERMALSQVIASAAASTQASTDQTAETNIASPPADATLAWSDAAKSYRLDSAHAAVEQLQEAVVDRSPQMWLDEPHPQVSAPHFDVAQFQRGVPIQPLADAIATSQPRFHPSWEVDRFRWPAVCDELMQDWTASLTSIVRSLVKEAWRGGNVVAVTQFARYEGASTLALCLARIAASFHIRVALVDGNSVNPDLGSSLGLGYEAGWEAIGEHVALEDTAIGSLEDRLVVLPLGPSVATAQPPSTSLRHSVLARLASDFELVVVDTGPVFVAAHQWFAPPCAGTIGNALIVRDVRKTETAQLEDVCCRLRESGITNMSVVENFQFE